jgi:hypothetical protein
MMIGLPKKRLIFYYVISAYILMENLSQRIRQRPFQASLCAKKFFCGLEFVCEKHVCINTSLYAADSPLQTGEGRFMFSTFEPTDSPWRTGEDRK